MRTAEIRQIAEMTAETVDTNRLAQILDDMDYTLTVALLDDEPDMSNVPE